MGNAIHTSAAKRNHLSICKTNIQIPSLSPPVCVAAGHRTIPSYTPSPQPLGQRFPMLLASPDYSLTLLWPAQSPLVGLQRSGAFLAPVIALRNLHLSRR